jgi:1,4-dihydroxy-2-naphthoyl-CoA hydrolase
MQREQAVKPIWFQTISMAQLQAMGRETLIETLGIELTEIGPDYLVGTMPVDHRTHQPMGILHGGASVALAETLGSLAGSMVVDTSRFHTVGIEINANHVRAVTSGRVTGRASALHLGRSSQVWQIEIRDEGERLVCIARLTLSVLAAPLRDKERAGDGG